MAKDTHTHDTNGTREDKGWQKVGRDLVHYERVYCTCGKPMENNIIDRVSDN